MRAIKEREMFFDNPNVAGAITERSIRITLGRHVVFHHTLLRGSTAFGGLHEDRNGAESARQKKMSEVNLHISQAQAEADRNRWLNTPIIDLQVGQDYVPFGSGTHFSHGKNDGFHGSTIPAELRQLARLGDLIG